MTSIIEESQKAKQGGVLGFWRNKKFIYGAIVLIVIALSSYFFLNKDLEETKTVVQKEWTVKRGDIIVSVESDGKVVAKDGVELSFSVSGDNLEVDKVFIKEGDKVKRGDKIASVKTETLDFNLRNTWSSYQSALADYNETINGASDEDIADAKDRISSAELSLSQSKISLENTRQNMENNVYDAEKDLEDAKENLDDNKNINNSEDVKDSYEDLVDNIKAVNISLESILKDSDEIIGVDQEYLNDDYEQNLGVKDISTLNNAKISYKRAKDENENLNAYALNLNINSDYSDIDSASESAVLALQAFEKHLYDMKLMLDNTITATNLTQATLDTFISTISANRISINTKITTLNSKISLVEDVKEAIDDYVEDYEEALRDLENVKANGERDIKNSEANVKSKELSLEQAKRDYEELIAPLSSADLASARSRLSSASINLEKAQYELDKSVLISPIDGELVQLNYAEGDIIITGDNNPTAIIINNDTLFIEANIEEADISKLSVGQKVYATFDALGELKLEGEISFISLTSKTNNNGIVTYLVRVIFTKGEHQIREGMTAYLDFVSSEAKDVLVIPVASVRNVEGKPSVQTEGGKWVAVTTGFTDGKNVEVIRGLNAGDKIFY